MIFLKIINSINILQKPLEYTLQEQIQSTKICHNIWPQNQQLYFTHIQKQITIYNLGKKNT